MPVDAVHIEQIAYECSVEHIERFAGEHSDEEFYGFVFDCDSFSGALLLCLNSEDGLTQQWKSTYAKQPREYADTELRWSCGDWKYQGFNITRDSMSGTTWDARWEEISIDVAAAAMEDDNYDPEIFMNAICKALIRLERDGAFVKLKISPGFKTLVLDHDESLEDGWNRLNAARKRS